MISLKQLFKQKMINDDPNNYMGPGYYEASDEAIAKRRGGAVPYNQDTSKRSQIELKSSSIVLGPGSYDIPKKVHAALYQLDPHHPSSVFASSTKRIIGSLEEQEKHKQIKIESKLRRLNQLKVGSDTFNTENKNSILGQEMITARSLEEENALELNDPQLK